ncbi:MAG: DNA methyltransferase, partial [Gammaproteobacteria bacterium]|nr:DNA methyltransferase [Gammaproteobacteria bacterium]
MTTENLAVAIEENEESPGHPISESVSDPKPGGAVETPLLPEAYVKAIEVAFPVEEISQLAERESYRKEIFRPIYHIHKWWANRLGSVFRGIVLGAVSRSNIDIWKEFYKKHDLQDVCILDPFMGSGTTLGEAAKLGVKPVGCDINPISTFAVRQALTDVDVDKLERAFQKLEQEVRPEIQRYYTTLDRETNLPIPVLYCFWVKLVDTPSGETVPLFNSYIFSKDTYPRQKPSARIVCPACWSVNTGRYDATSLICHHCSHEFNPQNGPANAQYVTDSKGNKFRIKELLPEDGQPPRHKLYAIMALNKEGEKVYLSPNAYDLDLAEEAEKRLEEEKLPLPEMPIRRGHNTDQAIGYNYLYWKDFFNSRQLLCLGLLLKKILEIKSEVVRDQFLCLFSGTLEFNNLF